MLLRCSNVLLRSCKMLLRSWKVLYSGFTEADAAEVLEIAHVCWRMLCMLTNAIYAGVFWRILYMLTYADGCYADVCYPYSAFTEADAAEALEISDVCYICWRMLYMLTYADVCYICWRMLAYAIYADVCWRMPGFTEADAAEALEIVPIRVSPSELKHALVPALTKPVWGRCAWDRSSVVKCVS
jgi:hypothetical protein